jgi:hypothetical protein
VQEETQYIKQAVGLTQSLGIGTRLDCRYDRVMELEVWSVVIAAVAAGIAVWGVFVAHRANHRSVEANEIAKQSLAAQQRSVLPEWSENRSQNRAQPNFLNQSSRTIIVERLSTLPEAENVHIQGASVLPQRVEYGDSLRRYINAEGFPHPTHLAIGWRYEGETTAQVTERAL